MTHIKQRHECCGDHWPADAESRLRHGSVSAAQSQGRSRINSGAARVYVVAATWLIALTGFGWAGTVSPVQSSARPLGLDIVGLVQLAGSDDRANDFQQNALPIFQQVVNDNLGERQSVPNLGGIALDPAALQLEFDSDVRAHFVAEGAGYHNTLGFFTTPLEDYNGDLSNTDAQLIFPDASSSVSYLHDGTSTSVRTESEPLLPGDFVDLGELSAGTQINPFLIANGANGGTDVYTPDAEQNGDGIQHFISLAVLALQDSPYLLIGVEDLYGGGDRDYNDLVFVLDIGAQNVQRLVAAAVPLPRAAYSLIAPFLAVGFLYLRNRIRLHRETHANE